MNQSKRRIVNTIGFKVSIIYITLAIINIAFFTSIIFEGQVGLISDNAKFEAKELVTTIISSLKKISTEFQKGRIFKSKKRKNIDFQIDSTIKPLVKNYFVFTERGKVLFKSKSDVKIPATYIKDGMRAIANQDFSGREYFLKIDENNYEMNFYIPLKSYGLKKSILFINYNIKSINSRLKELYAQVIVIFGITILFHLFFAFLIFRIIIRPIKLLHKGSERMSEGDLKARVPVLRNDEIGSLSNSFNSMADSIEDKIGELKNNANELLVTNKFISALNTDLESSKRIYERDMAMAVNVQTSFFLEKPPETDEWDSAFVFRPASDVSGDLYDIYTGENGFIGASLFDVSGHGIASGLITMLSKSIIFRNFKELTETPLDKVMGSINDELISQLYNVDNYLTGVLIRYKNSIVEYVNAAHCDILLRSPDKKCEVFKVEGKRMQGGILGIKDLNKKYDSFKFKVEKGDELLIFSDGIIENRNEKREHFEMLNLEKSYNNCPHEASARDILDNIMKDYDNFVGSREAEDDITAILLKKK